MKHNAKLRLGAFFIFTLVVFFVAYFIGNFAPVVNNENTEQEVVYTRDVFVKLSSGSEVFNLPLKSGVNNCLINVFNNTADNEGDDVIVFITDKNNTNGKVVHTSGLSELKEGFNVESAGEDTPVSFNVGVSPVAFWSITCIKQPQNTLLFNN